MLSAMSVVGMPSCISSHAVSRAPCRHGPRLVGEDRASTLPSRAAERMTPSAVP